MRASRLAFAPIALALPVGCSLLGTDLGGYSSSVAPSPTASPDSGDGTEVQDGAAPAGDERRADQDSASTCSAPVLVDSLFSTSFGDWQPFRNPTLAATYPLLGSLGQLSSALLLPAPPDAAPDTWGALWFPTRLPLVAFDVDFDLLVQCANQFCADGFAFVWIDAPAIETLLPGAGAGAFLGIPAGASGGGVTADLFENVDFGDEAARALQILELDGTKGTAPYDRMTAQHEVSFPDAWHNLRVRVRNDTVTVGLDDQPGLVTGTVRSTARGLIGLTASTGQQTAAVAVRNFHGRFYDCIP